MIALCLKSRNRQFSSAGGSNIKENVQVPWLSISVRAAGRQTARRSDWT